jgi:phage terminase large subunit
MASAVVIPYGPRRVFVPYHVRKERWAALVAHRRCGKTVACINDLIARALQLSLPHGRYAYVAPFLAQAKEVAWEYLKRFSLPATKDKNESELWVELVNGSRIRIHGADNPDRLRGAYLDGVVLDEYADMRPSVWGEVIRPMLADRQGWATFIGTPKGRNEFYKVWDSALKDTDRWFALMLRASATGILVQSEIDEMTRDMTPEQVAQELECSFDAAIVGAYYGKESAQAEREGRIRDVGLESHAPVHTAWDLGFGDSTAIWFFQIVGAEIHVIDHYENNNHPLTHYLGVLKDRGYDYGTDFVPHDAKVRELIAGRTRVEFLSDNGRTLRVIPQHRVEDGINAGRLLVAKPTTFFDRTKCANGLEALRQYRTEFDEKTRAFKNNPRHDWTSHTADAFRYLALGWRELDQPSRPRDPIAEMIKPKTFADMIREHELEQADE